MTALFTSIPIDEVLLVTRKRLEADTLISQRTKLNVDQICDLLEFVLNTTYFVFNGVRYKQKRGSPMGSPVSPIVANLFMEDFEERAPSTFPTPPRKYGRYVDDTFSVLLTRIIQAFHDHINSISRSIKWTREEEKDGKLPILDVLITRKPDGSVSTSVYRKPTHTDLYLHYDSHHPQQCKLGIIKTLVRRAKSVCSDQETILKEIDHIKCVMSHCGYTKWAWKMANRNPPSEKPTEEEETKGFVTLPYVQGVSETIKRIFTEQKLKVAFKPVTTLRQQLV